MYNKDLLRDWLFTHLKTCGWYVDCPLDSTLPLKGTIREKFDYDFMEKSAFSKVKGESMVKYAKKMSTMYS
jgi:hypothetical protein